LDWLRHLRQAPGLLDQVRQILGGSIGLPRIASLLGSSQKINDLRPIEVGAFERPKARELATALFRSRNVVLEEQVMDAFLDQIGTLVPIFIHILASVVATEVQARNQPATAQLIRQCYEERALGPEYRICFEDYYERLDRYYSPEEARAAKVPVPKSNLLGVYHSVLGPTADTGKFDLLLTWLSDDFYVREAGEGVVGFWSSWMRDWWRTYHGSKP
jgi:hypothetical protein